MMWIRFLPVVLALGIFAGCQQPAFEGPAAGDANSPEALIEAGRYIVETSGCHDCHTPKVFGSPAPEPDENRRFAGHPVEAGLPGPLPDELTLEPGDWGGVASNHLTAWGGPWGISFGINLTPDQETGIGSWTEEMFIQALRTGRHQGTGRPILPPMPWGLYGKKTDHDLRAMFAYFKSLPAVSNPVPEPVAPEDLRP